MAIYQDYQTLANQIYNFGKLDEHGKDVTLSIVVHNSQDPEDKTTWKKLF